jgi:hypothetical protein
MELNQRRVMSPAEFIRECAREDESEQQVRRQFRQLSAYGLIEQVEIRKGGSRRGGVEHFYRALQATELDTPIWDLLPDQLKAAVTGVIFHAFGERIFQAMDAATIDARDDRHITWVTVPLDEKAWKEVIARLNALFRFTQKAATEAEKRLKEGAKPLIPTTVGLFGFESPPDVLGKGLSDADDASSG